MDWPPNPLARYAPHTPVEEVPIGEGMRVTWVGVQEDAIALGADAPKAGRHLDLGSPAEAQDRLAAVQLSTSAWQRRTLADLCRIVANSGRCAGPADEEHRVLMGRSEVDRAACGCLTGARAEPVARWPQAAQLPPRAGHGPPRPPSNRELGLGLRRLSPTHPLVSRPLRSGVGVKSARPSGLPRSDANLSNHRELLVAQVRVAVHPIPMAAGVARHLEALPEVLQRSVPMR